MWSTARCSINKAELSKTLVRTALLQESFARRTQTLKVPCASRWDAPLSRTKSGNQFLLTVMCCHWFSWKLWLSSLPPLDYQKLRRLMDTNFLSKTFKQTLQSLGVSHSVQHLPYRVTRSAWILVSHSNVHIEKVLSWHGEGLEWESPLRHLWIVFSHSNGGT